MLADFLDAGAAFGVEEAAELEGGGFVAAFVGGSDCGDAEKGLRRGNHLEPAHFGVPLDILDKNACVVIFNFIHLLCFYYSMPPSSLNILIPLSSLFFFYLLLIIIYAPSLLSLTLRFLLPSRLDFFFPHAKISSFPHA